MSSSSPIAILIANPIDGTFLDNIRHALIASDLSEIVAEEYKRTFTTHCLELNVTSLQLSAFEDFSIVNTETLVDVLGLDQLTDQRCIRKFRDALWQAMTGINPTVAPSRQRAVTERLKHLGIH